MPLQTGTWTINSNGTLGQLIIGNVDIAGNLIGSLLLGSAVPTSVTGLWDEISQKVAFRAGPTAYIGFVFQDRFRMPGLTGSVVSTLVGYIEAFGAEATADRHVFGWYAQIGTA